MTITSLEVVTRSRVVIDNDWAGDPDGLVGLAHHLLSPSNRVDAITSSFLSPLFGIDRSAERGAALAAELVTLVGASSEPMVHIGSDGEFSTGKITSAASEAIVREARRDDPLPLYVVCAGPLTNVAAALHAAPDITARFTLVWVGGCIRQGAAEYNRDTDREAAAYVFALPGLRIEQFPLETYRRCAYSVSELEHDLGASGAVGNWLWTRFLELPLPSWLKLPELWPLGDSPPVLVTALGVESSSTRTAGTSDGQSAELVVYTDIDFRLIVGDLLAKLRGHEHDRTLSGARQTSR